MSLRRIEIVAGEHYAERIQAIAEKFDVLDYRAWSLAEGGRRAYALLIGRGKRQELLDKLQTLLGRDPDARIVVFQTSGIKPRTWLEQRAARQSVFVSVVVWSLLLAILASIIVFRQPV